MRIYGLLTSAMILSCCAASAQEFRLHINDIENDTDGITKCVLRGEFTNATDKTAAAYIGIFAVLKPGGVGLGIFDDLGSTAFQSNVYRSFDAGEVKDNVRLKINAAPCDAIETMYIYMDCTNMSEADCNIPFVVTGLEDFSVPVVYEAPPAE